MKQSFSFWLLCSGMLLSANAFAAEEALPAKTTPDASVPAEVTPTGDDAAKLPWAATQEKSAPDTAAPAPVELKPSNQNTAVKPQPASAREIPPAAGMVPLATSNALSAPKTPVQEHGGHQAPSSLAGGLTLDAAIQKALNASPRLRSATASVLASRGERSQASALPNPEVGVETENFAGKGDYKGTKSLETTVGVTQLIELGGKRSSRMDIADQGMALSQLDLEAERLNLIRDVTVAFVEVAASEEHLKIVGEQRDLAEDVFSEVSKRVSAAREPMIQQSKAEVTRATARIAYENAGRELAQAKRKLTALWGGSGAEPVVLDTGTLFELQKPPPAPAVENTLAQNPDFTRWDAEIKRSQATYDLERANAIPDPRISVGMRDFRESSGQAFVAGLSIPIPVFNMNRGNIDRARHIVSKTESDAQATKLQLGTDLSQRYQEMNIAYTQVESLEHEIIPAAEKSFRLSRAGYREGKFAFLEILDAQRTLFDAKEQRVSALRSYHTARAEVERLSAKNLQNTVVKEDDHAQ